MEDSKPLRLFWLGTPQVVLDGKPVKFETRKALALLVYLSQEDRLIPRESLAALFWPEFSPSKAFANLRRNLASLDQSLPGDWLLSTRETIGMANRQDIWLDTEAFQEIAGAAADSMESIRTCEKAAALYRGPFLEGFNLPDCPAFDDWQLFQREEHQRKFAALLQQIVHHHARASDWEAAIRCARKWVALDKFHEPAQQTLTQLYLQSGQRSAAVQQYEAYQRLLQQELNQEPGPEFKQLFKQTRSDSPTPASPSRVETDPAAAQRQADIILKTKLFIPNIRSKRVERTHLIEQLNQGLDYRLTLVSAPAGYGKSTLLGAWVRQSPYPVAWLSLDADDNEPLRYIKYITSALQNVVPESINLQESSPQASLFAFSPSAARNYLVSMLNRLCEVDEPTFLILDDYQFISSSDVNELTAFLIEKMPEHMHIIISTRSDPLFPLARLRAQGHILELRAVDLRFTEHEAAQFLNDTMRLSLDIESVAALAERTEGWIAGLQMASIAMQSSITARGQKDPLDFIRGFSGTNRFILDYLLEEVLASQPSEVQQFLLCTSLLNRLSVPLCDYLIEGEQAAAILDYLERENLFLVPLDEERAWFRYHHLFAELLKARLQQSQPNQVSLLHARASDWLEKNGYIYHAIQHRMAANETSQAADLMERYGPARLADGDPSIFRIAENLPQEVIIARPMLGLYQSWLLIIQGRIDRAYPLMNALADALTTDRNQQRRWMQTVITTAQAFLSPPPGMPGYVLLPEYDLLEEIPEEERMLHRAAEMLYSMALARRGQLDFAVKVSLASIQREKTLKVTPNVPTLVPFLSRVYLMLGRLHACYALCHEYLDLLPEQSYRFTYTDGSMQTDLGEVLYQWNRLDEAEQIVREGLLANETWRNIMTDGFGLVALSRILLAKGDFSGAAAACDKFETRLYEHARPREFDEDLHTLRARIQLASGDLYVAARWADEVTQSEDFRTHPEFFQLTLARIRLAQGRCTDVETLLSGITPILSISSHAARQMEAYLVLAAAFAKMDRLPDSLTLVEKSLAMAEPEGYIRIFYDVGEPACDLLDAYLRSGAPKLKQYAQKVLEGFPP